MTVFVQNEAGSNRKHYHNEKTLKLQRAVEVSERYPFPYGFVDAGVREKLSWFVRRVFAHIGGKRISVGRFLGPDAAEAHVIAHLDSV